MSSGDGGGRGRSGGGGGRGRGRGEEWVGLRRSREGILCVQAVGTPRPIGWSRLASNRLARDVELR